MSGLDHGASIPTHSGPPRRLASGGVRLAALAALLAVSCGDGVSSGRIDTWKADPAQHERLVAALKTPSVPVPLRADAAAALVDVGAALRVESAVSGLTIEDRASLIPALVSAIARGLKSREGDARAEARDALFGLRRQATTAGAVKAIDEALLPELERALRAGDTTSGRTPAPEMLETLRAAAVPVLHRVLADAQAPFGPAVAILDKVGDPEARGRGGAALVGRARAAGSVPAELWGAIGTLGGKEASAFLVERVTAGGAEAEAAALAMTKLRRTPDLLPFALETTARAETPLPIRRHLLEVARKVGGAEAQTGLLALLAKEPDPGFRHDLYGATLKVGGSKAIRPALEAYPQGAAFTPEEIRERLVGPLAAMGWEAREGVFASLESRAPLARLVAVWTLEQTGFKTDGDRVAKLAKDRATVRGLSPARSVGREAARVASTLAKQQS